MKTSPALYLITPFSHSVHISQSVEQDFITLYSLLIWKFHSSKITWELSSLYNRPDSRVLSLPVVNAIHLTFYSLIFIQSRSAARIEIQTTARLASTAPVEILWYVTAAEDEGDFDPDSAVLRAPVSFTKVQFSSSKSTTSGDAARAMSRPSPPSSLRASHRKLPSRCSGATRGMCRENSWSPSLQRIRYA